VNLPTRETAASSAEARDWIGDCVWADADAIADEEIASGVDRRHDGGWAEFVYDERRPTGDHPTREDHPCPTS
jgi:hypothetical protein